MGPFDRFNDRAKRVLALAQDEAIRFNHNYIGVEHLLLGLVREGEGVAARVLDSLGIDLSKMRSSVEVMIGRGKETTSPSEITLSPRTKKVIELAVDESRKLGHSHVGTEHLLLGIVREGESVGAGLLQSMGVSLEQVRHQVIALMGQHRPEMAATASAGIGPSAGAGIGSSHPVPFVDRLETSGRRALARAYWEAGRANDKEVAPHHLLLGLVTSGDVWTHRLLTELGVELADLVTRIDAAVPRNEGPRPARLDEQAALTEVFARAASFASERNSALIRSGHLLLAIAAADSAGGNVLKAVGATPGCIREILDRMNG